MVNTRIIDGQINFSFIGLADLGPTVASPPSMVSASASFSTPVKAVSDIVGVDENGGILSTTANGNGKIV